MRDPRVLAVVTVLLWAPFGAAAKLVSVDFRFLCLLLGFACTTCFFVALFLLRRGGPGLAAVLRQRFRPSFVLFGLLGYFVYWFALVQCFREFATASGSTVLNYTWPLFTVVFTEALFRREKKGLLRRGLEGIGLLLGFLSVLLLASRGDLLTFDAGQAGGVLWGLLAGASYGLFSAYSGTLGDEDRRVLLLVAAAASLLAMLPFGLSEWDGIGELSFLHVVAILGIGIVADGIGYLVWTAANRAARVRKVGIAVVGSIMYFLPLLSVLVVALLWGESEIFEPYFAAVLVLLVAGSVLCQRAGSIAGRLAGGRIRR